MQNLPRRSWLPLTLLSASLVLGAAPALAAPDAYVANATSQVVTVIDTATDALVYTIAVGDLPGPVAVSPDGTRAYVANTASDTLSVIDTATNTVMATVAVAATPSALAVAPDGGRVYLLGGAGVFQVIDTALVGGAGDPVVAETVLGAPSSSQHAASIALLPDGSLAYVLVAGSLRVVDTATLAVAASLHVGNSPSQVAVSPDGARAYVTNSFGYDTWFGLDGQVVVVDTAAHAVAGTIPLFSLPDAIAITPDGTRAYVASVSRFWNTGYGMGFLPDRHVAVIDLETETVSGWILLPGTPGALAVTRDGSRVYVTIPGHDSTAVIDAETDDLATTIAVAGGPSGLAIAPPRDLAACENGVDDDGDGLIDARDPQCGDASDQDEACGIGFELALVLPPILWLRGRRRRG